MSVTIKEIQRAVQTDLARLFGGAWPKIMKDKELVESLLDKNLDLAIKRLERENIEITY